ncbi:hypothetical protein CVD28_00190 [Bacillus sp. M6-12]|uniref:hypothetical protein n=1 Tax=Bacillus sp. M6-12 TaxID=2054166 RepID=UPI000C757EF6|nr:hypothetical protein [Bacillus sp. M6-12]PLS18855.1 hypothetical protein CVD28_00190 [Bacillus sp. M6-12]
MEEQKRLNENKKKFEWTKKKIIATSIAGLLVLSGSVWGVLSFMDKGEEKEPTVEASVPEKIDFGKEDVNKSKYEKLLALDYTLLNAEVITDETKDNTLFMSVQVKEALAEDELYSLGKEAYNVLKKEVGKDDTISSVHINVFTSKEGYAKTQDKDYVGGHVEGLIQEYSSNHVNGNKAFVQEYIPFEQKTDAEAIEATLDFEVLNANVTADKTLVDADVIIAGGTQEQIKDMIASIVSALKIKNEGTKDVALRIYNSEENYKNGHINYEYSTEKPNIILKQAQFTF